MEWFLKQDIVAQAMIAGVGTYLLTVAGTVPVFFFRRAPRRLLDALMGFGAGVMVAASCWSLLLPALERGGIARTTVGLLMGAGILFAIDQVLPHLHPEFPEEAVQEGPPVPWRRSALLMLAITLHNFPEGMAVGVAYAAGDIAAANVLAVGIGLQNIPEGLAVALPLRRDGMSRLKAFWYGQLSATVEPLAAVIGAAVAISSAAFLPYGMAGAAGAMLYVVVEEMIPETTRSGSSDVATLGFIAGFTVMMVMDSAFG